MITRSVIFAAIAATSVLLVVNGAVRAQQAPPGTYQVPPHPAPPPAPTQPLPFSHMTHTAAGLQCQSCHTNPDPGTLMTFPATRTCMACHTAVAADSPAVVQLAEFARTGEPVPWVRVYQVMPGVIWAHRPHLQAGIDCAACHGDVTRMEVMTETTSVRAMATCISCHDAYSARNTCETCHLWPSN